MALPMATSIRSRALSRRDHVLNLLPPLTVVSKEDATMHDRLFSDNPPAMNYPENFPSKVLRHLGAWTFYSAPTKGELALLDKSMYDLENKAEITDNNDVEEKKHSIHVEKEKKHTPRTQSHYAGDDKKRLETRKGKAQNVTNEKQVQQTKEEEKVLPKETMKYTEQQKPRLTPESTQGKSSESNSLEKTKQQVSRKKGNKKVDLGAKQRSYMTRAPKNLQKNAQVKRTKPQPHVAKVEITLKKSRGKVLGGAETGEEISAEPLTVEGHNVSVPGHDRSHGQSYRQTHEAGRAGGHKETVKLNTTERKDSKIGKGNRSSNCDKDTAELDSNGNENTTASEKLQLKKLKHTVIKIPLQVNDSSEEADSNNIAATPPHVDDIKSQNKTDHLETKSQNEVDSLETEPEQFENAVQREVSSENLNSNLENDLLRDKRVTFSPIGEKEPGNGKKRAKSQTGRKKERKRSGKNRVKSG